MATLFIRNKPDIVREKKGRTQICKQRWDVIEVRPESRNVGGLMSRTRGKDDSTNGAGNFIHYRIHVPGLSANLKTLMESRHVEYDPFYGIGEFYNREPLVELPRRYYLDYDALPEWAKTNLEFAGECTLPVNIAAECIKRRADDSVDYDLFRSMQE